METNTKRTSLNNPIPTSEPNSPAQSTGQNENFDATSSSGGNGISYKQRKAAKNIEYLTLKNAINMHGVALESLRKAMLETIQRINSRDFGASEIKPTHLESKVETLIKSDSENRKTIELLSELVSNLVYQVKQFHDNQSGNTSLQQPVEISKIQSDIHQLKYQVNKIERSIEICSSRIDAIEDRAEPDIELGEKVRSCINDMDSIKNRLDDKVDTAILSQLAQHIVTKRQLKRYLQKKRSDISKDSKSFDIDGEVINILENKISQKVQELETKLNAKMKECINISRETLLQKIQDQKLENSKPSKDQVQPNFGHFEQSIEDLQFSEQHPAVQQLTRDFDEKLYLICSEISACKSLISQQNNLPFYKCAQWIWNSGSLKLGSAVPWNLETANTDRKNFYWMQGQSQIRIAEAGLYEINLAFFTKAKPSIQIVVNGQSVLSAINSPSYVVQHASGFVTDGNGRLEHGTVTGISLVDFMTLPCKSTLSIHYHGLKKGVPSHGFLGLKRL